MGQLYCRPSDLVAPMWHKRKEELEAMGLARSDEDVMTYVLFPKLAPKFLKDDQVEMAVQVNGKVRDRLVIEAGSAQDKVRDAALALQRVKAFLDGGKVVKVIVVQDRLINVVVKK